MRIIGGCEKGRRLLKLSGTSIRPTSDMIKEALFNMLPEIPGKRFLDLFAGTGSVGLEALSRGADQVVFVEKDFSCIEIIIRNLHHCRFEGRYECLAMSAEKALGLLRRRAGSFDLIFLDPPYDEEYVQETLVKIEAANLLCEDGCVAVQRSMRENVDIKLGRLYIDYERKYGDTFVSFYKLK